MHTNLSLKKVFLWYVSLSAVTVVFLLFLHVKLVQSTTLEQTDRTLYQSTSIAANVMHRMVTPRPAEAEIRSDLELLTTQYDSRLSLEIIDAHDQFFFRHLKSDPDVSLVRFRDLANNEARDVDLDGHRSFRIVTKRADGFILIAAFPRPTVSDLVVKDLTDNRYIVIMVCLLVLSTGIFIYNFFVRPVHKLNLRLTSILGQPSDSTAHSELVNAERWGGVGLTAKMIERLNTARSQALNFSSFASHELRTPLTIIRNQLEDALSADITSRILRKLVGGVYDDILRLTNTVESLLNLSTMQAGTFELKVETIPVQQFFKKFYDEAFILTRPKNIAVVLGKGPELYVSGDPFRLRQVFFNLLDNAVKNTPENHRIHLGYELDDHYVLIKFADSGNGIPPDLLPRVFEPFVRGNDTSNDDHGVGLGLALVKLIVELHNGSISVESKVGTGTTFFLRFPSVSPIARKVPPENRRGKLAYM